VAATLEEALIFLMNSATLHLIAIDLARMEREGSALHLLDCHARLYLLTAF
jgi:hypothetical protein